ncbi:hypothetical protein M9458_041118, partial [Cirrhinus mrigala]
REFTHRPLSNGPVNPVNNPAGPANPLSPTGLLTSPAHWLLRPGRSNRLNQAGPTLQLLQLSNPARQSSQTHRSNQPNQPNPFHQSNQIHRSNPTHPLSPVGLLNHPTRRVTYRLQSLRRGTVILVSPVGPVRGPRE